MPRETSFSIIKESVDPAAESLADCKAKIRKMADSLADVEKGLKNSSASSEIRAYGSKIGSIKERMYTSAEKVCWLGETASYAGYRYMLAEQNILGGKSGGSDSRQEGEGQQQEESSGSGSGSSSGSGSGSDGSGTSGSSGSTGKSDEHPSYKKTETNYTEPGVSGWQNDWSWSNIGDTTYSKANVTYKWDEKTGKYVPTVTSGYDKKTSVSSFGFLRGANRTPQLGTTLGEIEKKSMMSGKNYFRDQDNVANDYSRRVWNENNQGELELETTREGQKRNDFSKDVAGAKIVDVSIAKGYTAYEASASAKGKYGEAGASFSAVNAEVHAGASAGVYYVEKDGVKKLAVGADVQAGASFSALKGTANASTYYKPGGWLGDDFQVAGASAKAEVNVGKVEAMGSVTCRYIDGQLEVAAGGSAGIYAATASATGSVTALGVTASATASVTVGVGVNAKVGITGGKLRCEFGASLGIGFKINFEIDFSGLISGIKNVVTNAVNWVKNAAKTVGNALSSAAKQVGKWLTSW